MGWTNAIGFITAVATLTTAVGGVYLGYRVQTVHKIVNQQRTDMVRYQRALIVALKAANVDVPDDQSTLE